MVEVEGEMMKMTKIMKMKLVLEEGEGVRSVEEGMVTAMETVAREEKVVKAVREVKVVKELDPVQKGLCLQLPFICIDLMIRHLSVWLHVWLSS